MVYCDLYCRAQKTLEYGTDIAHVVRSPFSKSITSSFHLLFAVLTSLSIVVVLLCAASRGKVTAARAALMLSFLMPTWVHLYVGAADISARVVPMGLGVLMLVAAGRFSGLRRLLLLDAIVGCLGLIGICTMLSNGMFAVSAVPAEMIEWWLPYLFGRLLIQSTDDLRDLAPWVGGALVLLSALTIVEAITHINPLNAVAGRSGSWASSQNHRWGLQRADGVLKHPIYMGIMLAALLPWALFLARRASQSRVSDWWSVLPPLVIVGTIATMSRGAIIIVLAIIVISLAVRVRGLRWPIAGLSAALLAAVVAVGPTEIVSMLESSVGDDANTTVTIGGRQFPYSGTQHRLLLFRVYEPAIADAGWFGFGNFDLEIPRFAEYVEAENRQLFRSIDNAYLLLLLNRGWLAAGLVVTLLIAAILALVKILRRDDDLAEGLDALAPAIGGVFVGLAVILFTVWLDPDFSAIMLITIGVVAGWRCSPIKEASSAAKERNKMAGRIRNSRKQLVPALSANGHATSGPSLNGHGKHNGLASSVARASRSTDANDSSPAAFAEIAKRHWYYYVAAAAVATGAALFAAYELSTEQSVFQGRLEYRQGNYWGLEFKPAELSTVALRVASPEVTKAVLEHPEPIVGLSPDSLQSNLVTRVVPGTNLIEYTIWWEGEAVARELADRLTQAVTAETNNRRNAELDRVIDRMAAAGAELALEAEAADEKLAEFLTDQGVDASVAGELDALKQEKNAIEAELFSTKVRTKGLEMQIELIQRQASSDDPSSSLTPDVRISSLDRKIIKAQEESQLNIELEAQERELARARELHMRRLISTAELDQVNYEVEKIRARLNSTEQITAMELERERLEKLDPRVDFERQKLQIELTANKGAEESLAQKLIENRQKQESIREMTKDERHLEQRQKFAVDRQLTTLNQIEDLRRLKNSDAFTLVEFARPSPGDPSTVSNAKKVFAASFVGMMVALVGPLVVWDYSRSRRLASEPKVSTLASTMLFDQRRPDSRPMLAATVNDRRWLAHTLMRQFSHDNFMLSIVYLGEINENAEFVEELIGFLARLKGRVLWLELSEHHAVDAESRRGHNHGSHGGTSVASSTTVATNGRATAIATKYIDRRQVGQVFDAFEIIEQERDHYGVIVCTGTWKSEEDFEVESLAMRGDGVLFVNPNRGGIDSAHADLVKNIRDCEANVLGVVS